MNFGELKQMLATVLPAANSTVSGGTISGLYQYAILMAVKQILEEHTWHGQMTVTTFPTVVAQKNYALGTIAPRMVKPIAIYQEAADGARWFVNRHALPEKFLEDDGSASRPTARESSPSFCYLTPTELWMIPAPSVVETWNVWYYQDFADLSVDESTNWLTENEPELIQLLAAEKMEAYVYNDARIGLWHELYEKRKLLAVGRDMEKQRFLAETLGAPRSSLGFSKGYSPF
jgi:hypothetical protein